MVIYKHSLCIFINFSITVYFSFCNFIQNVGLDTTVEIVEKCVAIAEARSHVITLPDPVLGHVNLDIKDQNVTKVCK